ncbi:MAG TPA: hypothetical protein VFA63_18385 [Pseudonocardiaceae bacterium]|nr:hypothetical protein [Pseudonocardiaceae bacterium]
MVQITQVVDGLVKLATAAIVDWPTTIRFCLFLLAVVASLWFVIRLIRANGRRPMITRREFYRRR